MTWTEVPAWGLPAPQCLPAPHSRDNHLGNTEPSGQANTEDMIPKTLKYTWKLPDIDEEACVLRIRYNISIGDYDQFAVDENNDSRIYFVHVSPKPSSKEMQICARFTILNHATRILLLDWEIWIIDKSYTKFFLDLRA